MSKCALRHWSGYSGAHHAGESKRYMPRHAAEKSNREGCFPGGEVVKAAVGFIAITAAAIGATNVGASIDGKYVDDEYDKADTSIQQPAERKSAESTGTPPQPAGLDSVIDQSPEERRIVIDRASRVSACDIRSQQGKLKKKVICTHPDVFAYLGASPAEESSSNMPQVFVDNREQSTSA